MAPAQSALSDLAGQLKTYASQGEEQRVEVRDLLVALSADIETPFEQVHYITFSGPTLASVLQVCHDVKLFEKWEKDGGQAHTVDELAKMTASDPDLLARLLKQLVSMNKIKQVGKDQYTLTPFTRAMAHPGVSNAIPLLYHSIWPVMSHLPKFLKQVEYRNPTDKDNTNYHALKGSKVDYFEQLDKDSERLVDFQHVMQMYATLASNWTKLYPTDALFDNLDPKRPLLVDAGGGKGQDLLMFQEKYPQLAKSKGSLILEELPSVTELVPKDLHDTVTVIAHDLFNPQPESARGARAYLIHSVFHGWTSDQSVKVLKRFADAMEKGYSKLILHEKVVTEENATRVTTASDVIMMATFSAHERTQAEWAGLLAEAGLRMTNVYLNPIYPEGIIEAELLV